MSLVEGVTSRRLEAVLAEAQRRGRLPVVVAGLTRDGVLAWTGSRGGASGHRDVRPLDLQFRVGSITKTMTAVLVLQLRDAGLLDLADPVSAYLPEVAHGDRTLRALLSHAGGLPAEPAAPWWERSPGRSFAQLAAEYAEADLPFETGRTHHYSNLGYALLGEVVARVSGRSWGECVAERLLGPLGMAATSYEPTLPHAVGYSVHPYADTIVQEPATDTAAMAPAGQLWSTVQDLSTYADFLASGRPEVLADETLVEMTTPQSGTADDGLSSGYGLGLRLLAGGSGTLVGHTGSMPGFQASLFVDRVRRTGAVVLANSTRGLPTDGIAPALLATLEEVEPTLAHPWTPSAAAPAEIAELLGVWHWGNTPRLCTWDGELLNLRDPAGSAGSSFRRADGRLVGVRGYHMGEPLEVHRGADGSVSHLTCSSFVLTRGPYDPLD